MPCKECKRLEDLEEEARLRVSRLTSHQFPAEGSQQEDAEFAAFKANLAETEVRAHKESCEECKRGYPLEGQ
jgi:hypothetical protein